MKKPRIIEGPLYFARHAPSHAEVRAQLEEGFRAAAIERGEIDKEERVVPIIFATEAPVMRHFGRERLLCQPDAVRITRMNGKAPLLSEHDRSKQIGVIVPNSVTFGADKKARCKVRFAKHGQLADEEWNNLIDDIRGTFSVGYVVHRLVLREEDDKEGDLYDAVDWEPLENSLVSVPADPDCIIDGRAETSDKHPVLVQAENEQTSLALSTMKRNARNYFARQMAPDTGANPQMPTPAADPTAQQRAQQEAEAQRKKAVEDARKEETERVRELAHLGVAYGKQEEAAKYMNDGTSVQEFRNYLLDNGCRKVSNTSNDPGNGANPLLTQGGSPSKPLARSIGDHLVESEALKEYTNGSRSKRSASFELPEFNIRATLASTAIPAGVVSAQGTTELPYVPAIQLRLTIVDLMRQGSVSTGTVHYMKEVLPTNAATAVSEGGLKPEATFTFTDATASVRKIAVIARVNDEALQDYAFLRSYLDEKLLFMIREREEALVLAGDGVAPNLLGFLNTPDIQTQAKGTDTNVDAIHKAITKIRVTGQAEPDGIVMHPNDAQIIFLAKDANGQYLAGGPFYAPYGNGPYANTRRVWGLPLVETTVMTEGTALVGAFRQYSALYRRSGITVETTNSDGDDFKYNRTAIRVEERIVNIVERPQAFATITGIA